MDRGWTMEEPERGGRGEEKEGRGGGKRARLLDPKEVDEMDPPSPCGPHQKNEARPSLGKEDGNETGGTKKGHPVGDGPEKKGHPDTRIRSGTQAGVGGTEGGRPPSHSEWKEKKHKDEKRTEKEKSFGTI